MNRKTFDRLRARCLKTSETHSDFGSRMRLLYGPAWERSWLSRQQSREWDRLKASKGRAEDAMFDYIASESPRDWSRGVPFAWVCRELSYEDASRPKTEALSVVPPLSYGSSEPVT